MKHSIKWMIIIILFSSCKSKNIEKNLEKCVFYNYSNSLLDDYTLDNIDYYKDILLVENSFIKNSILSNSEQDSYKKLIYNLNNINKEKAIKIINDINNSFEKQKMPKFETILTSDVLNCITKFYSKKNIKNKHPIIIIGMGFDKLKYNFESKDNLDWMFYVIDKKDFDKKIFHSFYVISVYLYLLEISNLNMLIPTPSPHTK